MKTVLSIQDLSCVGRCSLTVAMPVISAMGCRCSVLPTALLSTHTGFPDPHVIPLTDHIEKIAGHFFRLGLAFDAVTTGYLANPEQAMAVEPILRHYRQKGSLIIADPAMADHGRLYGKLGPDHAEAMARLCGCANILLPNVTEAALLAGLPYREQGDAGYWQDLTDALLERFPADAVLITGVSGKEGYIGFTGCHRQTGPIFYQAPVVPRQFHGTGDLFAAVFVGAAVKGADLSQAGKQAADFVSACVAATPTVTPQGVEFESQLYRLLADSFHHT